jgi:hypothetical protein
LASLEEKRKRNDTILDDVEDGVIDDEDDDA